jgi:hypothetical protein
MGVGIPGSTRPYVSGLCAATLGLCAAGWLALAPVAFGYRDGAPTPGRAALHRAALHRAALHRAVLADWGTAAALAVVSLATLLAWIVAWRRQLRADGVLAGTSWREARALRRRARAQERAAAAQERAAADAVVPADGPPDPARVLSELRALLIPLLAEPEAVQPGPGGDEPAVRELAVPEPVVREPVVDEAKVDEPVAQGPAVPLPRPGGLAAMESMLAGAELLMVACGEEEAW